MRPFTVRWQARTNSSGFPFWCRPPLLDFLDSQTKDGPRREPFRAIPFNWPEQHLLAFSDVFQSMLLWFICQFIGFAFV